MNTITLTTIAERKKLTYVEWLRAEAARLRDGNDIDEIRVANRLEAEADMLEGGWPLSSEADAA